MEGKNSGKSIQDEFHDLEKQCIGFENFINNEEKYYLETLENLRQLVERIQKEHVFSDNESLKEIDTDNLK